jgi:diguanylate cyclase (GGDEF)-like protein
VASWEFAIAERLKLLGLGTIRRRILAFGVLAALIPVLTTGTISYTQSRNALNGKITDQLRGASFQASREVDLFFKERLYDLRVFSNSYEVSENLERLGPTGPSSGNAAGRRLGEFLRSVKKRSTDFEEMMVLDRVGRIVASSADRPGSLDLPDHWLKDMGSDGAVMGSPHWDDGLGKAIILLIVPVTRSDYVLGGFAARVALGSVGNIMRRFAPGDSGEVALVTGPGRFIVTSQTSSAELMQSSLTEGANQALAAQIGKPVEFQDRTGAQSIGTMQLVPRLDGAVIAALPVSEAFKELDHLRNVTLLMATGLLLAVGGLAWILSLVIVRPLQRLRDAAARVAAGDLDVNLPVTSGDETGYLTQVFNDMVRRLRESREELERLSNTDALTGLFNRRHLMETLTREVQRATRTEEACTVLMIDVDHFKRFNDTYGHPAGDAVLARVAGILQESIRSIDIAGRYGGEEFLLLLSNTTMAGGLEVADRIRAKLATEAFDGGRITVSVGAAQYPEGGRNAESLIMSADLALYQAKKEGRDRVVQATAEGGSGN